MRYLPGIFALLIGVAGWFYLFYSRAAQRLSAVEDPHANLQRQRLRRINGFVMLLFGAFFYAGYYAVDETASPAAFVAVWLTAVALLLLIVLLALLDVRLTARLRRKR